MSLREYLISKGEENCVEYDQEPLVYTIDWDSKHCVLLMKEWEKEQVRNRCIVNNKIKKIINKS